MAIYPPSVVCRQLFDLHRHLRLAWHVPSIRKEGELNPGSFAIVQLYHIRDAGTVDKPNTFLLHWEEAGQSCGLVFNRYGGTSKDYDPLFRRPIYVANLAEHGVTVSEIMSGAFLHLVKHWLRPMRERLLEAGQQKENEMKSAIQDQAREQTDYLWHLANRSDSDTIVMPYSDARQAMVEWEQDRERNQQYLRSTAYTPGLI